MEKSINGLNEIKGLYNREQAEGFKYFLKSKEELVIGSNNGEPTIIIGASDERMLPDTFQEMNVFDKAKCSFFRVYSFIELDEKFEKLMQRLEVIRVNFGQEIFDTIRFLPVTALNNVVTDKTKFYEKIDNGQRDFLIHSVVIKKRRPKQ